MKTTDVELSINYIKTWKIKYTDESIDYDSEKKYFYHFQGAGKCVLDFEADKAAEYLQMCDEAVSNGLHEIPLAKLYNTSFLSMVLTQFLHVPKTTPAHDVEEPIRTHIDDRFPPSKD
jgi:hypothetical protein